MPAEGRHLPVLLHEAIQNLAIAEDDIVVDATLGGAGHSRAITGQQSEKGTFIGFDLDAAALERARHALKDAKPTVHLVKANFRHLASEVGKLGIRTITKALFDLGWSSYQLDSGRGFSFLRDEPLQMTYSSDAGSGVTAATIVNEWKEETLADIIYGFGEERYSRRIAKAIVEHRVHRPFITSVQLADVIKAAVPSAYRFGRLHPATRTFQALRIAVNDELGALEDGIRGAWRMLVPGGRIAVITFHSIEDRVVKRMFAAWEKEGGGKRITRKPLVPSERELAENPRSRSAKLRIVEKSRR